jgi:CheR methyltransferase, SAM binding domain/CheR methyltransferase, all-alpha domain
MNALRSPHPETDAPRDAEFGFGAAEFERVRKLIYQRAGISLHAGKQAMVYSRLSRRLRELRHASFASYLQWLESATGDAATAEWQEFVNCLTTNLTSFFREEHHFPMLAAELTRLKGRALRLWCNAASTGEEPYSLAMTVIEALGANADVEIFCSDIDTKVLATAERGVYAADSRGLSTAQLQRHFLKGTGANAGLMRAKPELKPGRVRAIQPDAAALVARCAVRHRFLSQRHDLFRRADATPRARTHAWRDGAARSAVRRAFGKLQPLTRLVPAAQQDGLRAALK